MRKLIEIRLAPESLGQPFAELLRQIAWSWEREKDGSVTATVTDDAHTVEPAEWDLYESRGRKYVDAVPVQR